MCDSIANIMCMALAEWIDMDGTTVYVHRSEDCTGPHCPIHRPSEHHMRDWPQHWRDDRGIMERICPHGIGHPDPDDKSEDHVHGCDGCCTPPR